MRREILAPMGVNATAQFLEAFGAAAEDEQVTLGVATATNNPTGPPMIVCEVAGVTVALSLPVAAVLAEACQAAARKHDAGASFGQLGRNLALAVEHASVFGGAAH